MKADLATYQAEVDEAMKGIKTKANAYFVYNSDYDNLNDEQINQISSLIDNALTEAVADTFNKDSDINSKFVQKIIDGIENNKEGISKQKRKNLILIGILGSKNIQLIPKKKLINGKKLHLLPIVLLKHEKIMLNRQTLSKKLNCSIWEVIMPRQH